MVRETIKIWKHLDDMNSFALKAMKFPLTLFLLLVLQTGCEGGRNGRLPASTGQPYEVVVEGDTDSIVTKILTKKVPCLPQPEPLCNVINVKKGKVKGSYLMVRTRIVVDIDRRYKKFSLQKRLNQNASPQIILFIKAKNTEQLKDIDAYFEIRNAIDQSEKKHLASLIKQNPKMQKEVKRLFGIDMKIPADMESSKQGKDFMWISNNASTGMQNLLFIKLKSFWKDSPYITSAIRTKVDSALKVNMPGEEDGMYMQLKDMSDMSLIGLWEMKGDAMGGPFTMRLLDSKNISPKRKDWDANDALVVMGFVYAPEMKKRNLTKQLEAVLTTIK